ncbi:FosX/FosE/FosI family fosfomycin resistance thiol transferase [Listeria monocytogenes]|uniref:Putative glutathione transferase-fosfomycin resistance protein n=1 Tax=Listeria monocytogenes serotype 4a (strain M7) TaxID=1030009 RepID=A0A0E0UWU1_LISMM|nr:fosfomycin resistance hydrolase FosX [Listeria monocytogenes]ACK39213.1 glyoxalase family protein [Listeria monocytogenes HCC23]AEH92796.1 putative glutathione transferase -fosfomycin resistance protein [Listeria monocytogenes M7]AKS54308.1 Fosfomycin resistance protein FosX [Listeria monocytogenes]EAC5533656.1 FosX/FosE/FosI family fosfomycin resistance thiol transferase [Listeria monocytogenes]EAC5533838.1 FosX/FosE/FosI family fosfomycin resistance thiol transferase [Listeria monocytogen
MISGLSHITLIVKDLNKTTTFLKEIFNAEEIYSSGDKIFSLSKEKFFLIAGLWICIMEGESLQERTYNHIAFQIQSEEVDEYIERIKALGVEMKPERPRVEGEGHSIYFYDFDNHLFELHAGTLEERLKRYHE